MSSPKRGTITLLLILSFTILSLNLPNSLAWTPTEITSNSNLENPPVIDGILDESWNTNGNKSFHTFGDGGRGITLYVQHDLDYIYILVEVKFVTTYNTETISLYLSNSTNETETGEIFDKKQITLFDITNQGNESTYLDYYLSDEELYIPDSLDEGFEGAAKIGNGTDTHRYYEYKLDYQPLTENLTEDSSIKVFEKLSINIGINNTETDETISNEALSIQIGPKGIDIGDDTISDYDFDTELYMMIVLISVSVIFGVYGIILISVRAKNPQYKFMEED
ncbi:hypothetical protein DSAG12_00708 [Promethearchaeum syntrophicum]|uniref:Uncharacterized protein n=1 Tax=Promethearchaeum syntrophicum TaxID=2594042 RepID=A0A5B9D7N8_9ARCH|nr:hypothetical protein [Candidatus Prometheoarchaeum syntrophicum]QEE14887.1 hypothetical protein DSAG12_00708 [Candidatus Prometheoarchaeum syntrophicum]